MYSLPLYGYFMEVAIIGGGLAGLSAAVALAPLNHTVTILEARPRLGGRASSFTDPASGELVDACQHVSMGCCTEFKRFAETLGIAHVLEPQPCLYFMTPDRRVSRFRRDPWPAPLHLGRAFAAAHYLTASEKLRIAWGLACLRNAMGDPPLLPWLQARRQTPRCIERFWSVVLTSALNENVEHLGLKYARKVFVDAFLADRDGFTVELPTVPLGRLYGPELRAWLDAHKVSVLENSAVRAVSTTKPFSIELRDGRTLTADAVVVAVPFDRVLDLLPGVANDPFFARIGRLEPSPITSVHFWFDRDALPYPHVVLVDCLGQWIFRRAGGYLQVVISATANLKSLGHAEIEARVLAELRHLFPALNEAKLLRSKVVTERTATFRAVPGVDAFRPPQRTPVPGLVLAGDYTETGWPATMEGAVRSGTRAAGAIAHASAIAG